MILVTVGTEQYPFNALMDWVNVLIRYGLIDQNEEVVVQYGSSSHLPDQVKIVKRLPESEFKALLEQARLVISHCGEGSVMMLESLGKPYILVPRTQKFGEHVDNHQLEMADALEKQGIAIARSPGDLVRFLAAPKPSGLLNHDEEELCNDLSSCYDSNKYKKVMLVCSSGGHFRYAQSLMPFLNQFQDTSWVTFKNSNTVSKLGDKKSVYWAHSPTNRNLPNLLRNLLLSFKVLSREQPDLVVSTGAGIAVPFLWIAHVFFRKQTLFIESKTRLKHLSLSAKLLHYAAGLDRLIVRSKDIQKQYPKSQYFGNQATALPTSQGDTEASSPMTLNETVILKTPSHFGVLEAPEFKNEFQSVCELEPKKIVIDMSSTRFMTSTGLGALVSSLKVCKLKGIELVLWSVNTEVMSVLSMASLDEVFQIENETSAVRTPNENSPQQQPIESYPQQTLAQRAIDMAVAALGLGIMTALFIPISIGIKLDSPGPIFSQEIRYGKMGKRFRMWKFRSTVTQADGKDGQTPAITKFGNVLRKTKLDQLPLLFNVLMGDMSLVGPAASTVEEVDYNSTIEWKALEVKPGIIHDYKAWRVNFSSGLAVTGDNNPSNSGNDKSGLATSVGQD
jgi:anti-anti-sigma factor